VDEVARWLPGRLVASGVPAAVAARLTSSRFAAYAGRLYPTASLADLRTMATLFTWFFLLDDAVDGRAAPALPVVTATVDRVRAALRGTAPGPDPLWRSWWPSIPAGARSRLADAITHHLDGIVVEATNKGDGHRPGVAEYIHLRRATSAAYVSYALIGIVHGDDLPDAVYHHPVLREVSAAGNDLLSWFNDLLSLDRDTATSGGHNLVLATARERGVPVRAAAGEVVARWRARMAGFVALSGSVPPFGPSMDAAVARYVDGVAASVRGTIDWMLESPRYPVPAAVAPWVRDL
jgi:hypothetical protein